MACDPFADHALQEVAFPRINMAFEKTLKILSTKIRVSRREAIKARAAGFKVGELVHTPPGGKAYQHFYMTEAGLRRWRKSLRPSKRRRTEF
jgi:hypothetical protein